MTTTNKEMATHEQLEQYVAQQGLSLDEADAYGYVPEDEPPIVLSELSDEAASELLGELLSEE